MKIHSSSEKQTREAATRFAKTLKPGSVLVFTGDLGGGKTTFTKGVAEGLHLTDPVTSPTFVLMQIYKKKRGAGAVKRMYHFDLYRMKNAQELHDLGFDDFLADTEAVTILEWGEKFPEIVPTDAIHVLFKNLGGTKREITVH